MEQRAPAVTPTHGLPAQERTAQGESDPSNKLQTVISLAATFTADPVRKPLQFWMRTLGISADVELAPYAQMMQQLLDPNSILSRNKNGCDVLLIRPEDWIRDRQDERVESNMLHLENAARELVAAVGNLRKRTGALLQFFICPVSASLSATYAAAIERVSFDLACKFRELPNSHCWTHADLVRLYRVTEYEDTRADFLAHIPYTEEYFVAMATLIARRISASVMPKHKVVAVDCDNTLWKGICGEDGPIGVEITPSHIRFQQMLVSLYDAGVLVCLCSKNNLRDVEAVFEARPEMPLRPEHLVHSCVNWNSKSMNLKMLARELDLSLDSFILIDDSVVECEEVRANCPTVLTLRFPEGEDEIDRFVDHTWVLDRCDATSQASRRTSQYRENQARKRAEEEAQDLEKFLSSLDLRVDVTEVRPEQLPRVAELIQRTTQFNFTSIRRRLSEVEALWRGGEIQIMVAHVRDRFGDYGLVGAVLFRLGETDLEVDTLVLSCRVLGRMVEHRVANELGRVARQAGRSAIVMRYRRTSRNQPAWAFLRESFGPFLSEPRSSSDPVEAECVFRVPPEYAENLKGVATDSRRSEQSTEDSHLAGQASAWAGRQEITRGLSRIADIIRAMNRSEVLGRRVAGKAVAPRTANEQIVAAIWADVLGIHDVGVEDDFFELGGDSLQAVRVLSRVGATTGLELSLVDFFEYPTIAALASRLTDARQAAPAVEPAKDPEVAPLSWAQQRLWFIDRLEGGNAAYHIPLVVRLSGRLQYAALRAALSEIVKRHHALRTVFVDVGGMPMQKVQQEKVHFELPLVDLRDRDEREREREVVQQTREVINAPFDLEVGPPIRGRLLCLSECEHVLLVTMHHIVSDGWSVSVLIRELVELYTAHVEGTPVQLPPLSIQFGDYARWQRQAWMESALEEQILYWKQYLLGAPEVLQLPADRTRPAVQTFRGASVNLLIGSSVTSALKSMSRRMGVTLAMTLFAAWAVLIARLSGQRDFVIGMPVANRRRPELEGLIGFFVNTLALRVRLDDHVLFSDLLQQVKQSLMGAYANQDVPFDRVVELLQPTRTLSHSAIVQVTFAFQNVPRQFLSLPGIAATEQKVPLETAQFDLSLSIEEIENRLHVTLNYASDLFHADTVQRWGRIFERLVGTIVRQPHMEVDRVSLIDDNERRQVVSAFNATDVPYPNEALVHQVFEARAARAPDALAVHGDGRSLTYSELNSIANQLAHHLTGCGVRSGERVALFMPRSLSQVISQLAVLKCCAAYVPIDPVLPVERVAFMLRDCGAQVVVAIGDAPVGLEVGSMQWVDLDRLASAINSGPARDPGLYATADLPAYVMYTSGSTGVPKGVVVSHRGINRLVVNGGYAEILTTDCVAHCSNPAFDASTFEIWSALLNGARLLIVSQADVLDARCFAGILKKHGVTVLFQTTALLHQRATECPEIFRDLRYVLFGGETADPTLVKKVLAEGRPQHLIHVYGPTETTTFATWYPVISVASGARSVPIGGPMSNTRIYVLDRCMQPVPIGVPGEIYIGGAGVALGYLNRPQLTEERFVADPFSADPRHRLYRSGDIGRWLPDGSIEFLGRSDQQVKIRGFRIEPAEIEARLLDHPNIREAAVLAREDVPGEKRLVAYVVSDNQQCESDLENVREHLKRVLPDYMIPSAFVMLDRLPLTSNGKLDRRALPRPDLAAYTRRQYRAPETQSEKIVAQIWQQLLHVERVGRDDNFFELGGHSLLATRVIAKVREVLHVELSVRTLFEASTLKQFATLVEEQERAGRAEEALWIADLSQRLRREISEMQEHDVLARIAELERELGYGRAETQRGE